MKLSIFIAFFVVCFQWSFSQEIGNKAIDSLYREDQFYVAVTYNLLGKKPVDLSQNGFSIGYHFGFIKDMPINKNRNLAIGIGLGYSANSFNQNMLISKDNLGVVNYSILQDATTYSKNKFSTHLVELPIEFRWRTSTAVKYEFWRIYTGFKLSYMFANNSKYNGNDQSYKYYGIKNFNNFQYGISLSAGYNTWNFYMYYALNPVFSKEATINGKVIDMNAIKIGLMFYIL